MQRIELYEGDQHVFKRTIANEIANIPNLEVKFF